MLDHRVVGLLRFLVHAQLFQPMLGILLALALAGARAGGAGRVAVLEVLVVGAGIGKHARRVALVVAEDGAVAAVAADVLRLHALVAGGAAVGLVLVRLLLLLLLLVIVHHGQPLPAVRAIEPRVVALLGPLREHTLVKVAESLGRVDELRR